MAASTNGNVFDGNGPASCCGGLGCRPSGLTGPNCAGSRRRRGWCARGLARARCGLPRAWPDACPLRAMRRLAEVPLGLSAAAYQIRRISACGAAWWLYDRGWVLVTSHRGGRSGVGEPVWCVCVRANGEFDEAAKAEAATVRDSDADRLRRVLLTLRALPRGQQSDRVHGGWHTMAASPSPTGYGP